MNENNRVGNSLYWLYLLLNACLKDSWLWTGQLDLKKLFHNLQKSRAIGQNKFWVFAMGSLTLKGLVFQYCAVELIWEYVL